MSTNGNDLVSNVCDRIRAQWKQDDSAGRKRTGRPTLVTELGVSDYYVRKALEELDNQLETLETSTPPAATSDPADPGSATPADLPPVTELDTAGVPLRQESASLETPPAPARQDNTSLVTWLRQRPWAVILIGIGAAFSVWSGWVGLGGMTGFGPVQPLPGIWDALVINSAIVLPISVEAYGAYALRVWLSAGSSQRTSIYAGISSIASLVVGGAAQVAYHLLKAAGYTRAPWQVVMAVALVPVVVLALASILAKLVSVDRQAGASQ